MLMDPNASVFVPAATAVAAPANRAPPAAKQGVRSAHLKDKADLDGLLQSDTSHLFSVSFGERFQVRDEHILQLVTAVGPQLASLQLGSSDTGDGVWVTDAGVAHIVAKCPKLKVLRLASCTQVTDAAFTSVLRQLGDLEELHCTGHDRTKGKLTNKALQPLLDKQAPRLQRLYITDQGVGFEAVQRLMKRRKGLGVLAGETDSDSAAWGSVLQQMGGDYGDGLYGNLHY